MPTQARFFRDITVKMTDSELAEAGKSLAAADYDLELLEDAKKSASKEWATKVEAKLLSVKELRDKVRNGTKVIPVECRRVSNETTFAVEIFRLDTNELVDSRPMTTDERNAILNPTLPGVPVKVEDVDASFDAGDDDAAPTIDAADAFSAPAAATSATDERDAFLANKHVTTAPKTADERDAEANEALGEIIEREATALESVAPAKTSAADFDDPWDQPQGDVEVPATAAKAPKIVRGTRRKANGAPGDEGQKA